MAYFPLQKRLTAAVAVLAFFAVACGDGTGPGELSDPAATAAAIQAVDAVFQTPVYSSFSVLGDQVPTPAPSPLAGVTAILRTTTPRALERPDRPYAGATLQANELRELLPVFSRMASEAVIPDPIRGTTFEWNATNDQYEPTSRAGAPANGVRFILYAIDPSSDLPAEPLVEVGYVDFIDVSTPTTNALQIVLVGGSTTYADYTVSVTATATSFSASAEGYVANGQQGPDLRQLGFSAQVSASETATGFTESVELALDLRAPAVSADPLVSVDVNQSVDLTETATEVRLDADLDLRLTRAGETVRLFGTVTIVGTSAGTSTTVNLTITVNGRTFATIRGTDGTIQLRGPGGRDLTPEEQDALLALLLTTDEIIASIEDLFDPVENLVGA